MKKRRGGTTLYGLSIVLWYFSIQPTSGPDFPIGPFFDQHACQIVQQNDQWLGEADGHSWTTTPCNATNAAPAPPTQGLREVPPAEMADPYHLHSTPVPNASPTPSGVGR